MNCLSWAEGRPNRVGVPNTKPSAHSMSSKVASGTSRSASMCAPQAGLPAIASGPASSRTLRSRVCAPASRAPCSTACAMAQVLPVLL
jgi:hypothetical protein